MATTIKTPTQTVSITLIGANGIDWSHDYIGNHVFPGAAGIQRDQSGDADYIGDDEDAQWWVTQCANQQEVDNALAELSSEDRADFDREAEARGFTTWTWNTSRAPRQT